MLAAEAAEVLVGVFQAPVVLAAAEQAVMIQAVRAVLTLAEEAAEEAATFMEPPSGAVLAAQELF